MRLQDRRVDSAFFKRRTATADTRRKIASWEVWTCADPMFSFDYDRTVTMFVQEGAAELTFANGETVDLQAGDTLTVQAGVSATWVITQPIRNSYQYHDTFSSASNRAAQVTWPGKEQL